MIQFGLRLHDGERLPLEELLPLVRQKGFTCAHLALSKAMKDYPCTPGALTPGYALYLRRLFRDNGIDIAVLGNYLNLAHPDGTALAAIQEKYYAHIRFASVLGCGMVGTETGAPNPEYRFCPECRSDEALATFIRNLRPVVRCAEQFGVIVAIEPVVKHIVYSAARARAAWTTPRSCASPSTRSPSSTPPWRTPARRTPRPAGNCSSVGTTTSLFRVFSRPSLTNGGNGTTILSLPFLSEK